MNFVHGEQPFIASWTTMQLPGSRVYLFMYFQLVEMSV